MADRRRIVQVLNNLLSNAARHAPESTPIRVAAVREDLHVALSVSDEGSGVAPERLPHLFSKHAAGGQGATAGHGLGLGVSKGLVEAHGGRIRAERPGAGRGTTVTFTIPAAGEAGAAAALTEPPPPAPEPGEAPRILVVADDPRALRFVPDALSDAGYAPLVTGAPQDVPKPSDVAALVERARSTFLSGGGRHVVLVDLPAGLLPVMADRRRVVKVLTNLFSNAARHAPESTPIRVAPVRENAHVPVSVSDEGRGVAPDLLPHLCRKHAGGAGGGDGGPRPRARHVQGGSSSQLQHRRAG